VGWLDEKSGMVVVVRVELRDYLRFDLEHLRDGVRLRAGQ
jgi:hypothetical protein